MWLTFAIIYGIMIFIWSFVYMNRSHDQINQAFLYFLSDILLWMILSVCDTYDGTFGGLVLKTIYWLSMMNMSLFFLYFVYRLIHRTLDALFFILIGINILTILSRYLFPIDYSDPTFWRLSIPVVAPLMSATFCFPAIIGLYLMVRQYRLATDRRQRVQLRYIYWGIGVACALSVTSEYLLPTLLHINLQLNLMFFAILIFVVATFIAIMKYRLLNMQSDYIFKKLFLNSSDGTIILNKNARIISINHTAKEILEDDHLDSGDRIADYIREYSFETDYKQFEVAVRIKDHDKYLSITQYPIDTSDQASVKLLMITDITATKLSQIREKDILIERSSIDQLTGLYNKQYFVDKYYANKRGASNSKLSILFIDIDNFKNINDRYGHLVGDKVLKGLAACIRGLIRSDTDVIRFGGDEFIVILESTRAGDAFAVAERIRGCTDSVMVPELNGKEKISLSIGLMEGDAPINDLLMKADMAMYTSKCKGKNTTTIYNELDNKIAAIDCM